MPFKSSSLFNKENLITSIFFVSALFIWFGILTTKYYNLAYYDWDLALYNQAVWNLSQGRIDSSLWGMNFLANHSEFILFFIVPIYKLFPHPLTLVFLKVISFISGSFILFRIAKEELGFLTALLISFLFLMYPPNIFALLHEFNIESLNIIFIFLLFYFYRQKKLMPYYLTLFFLVLIKENMPTIVIMFGLFGIFSQNRSRIKWGVIPLIFGIISLCSILFLIIPWFRKDFSSSNQYISIFQPLGNSFPEIFLNFFTHPQAVIKLITSSKNLNYINDLFRPLLYLPFFNPQILLLALPIFLQNLLSANEWMHTIYFHYAATLSPFIFIAAILTFHSIKRKVRPIYMFLIYCFIVVLFLINVKSYLPEFKLRMVYNPKGITKFHWQMIDKISPKDGVIASINYLLPLSQRKSIQSFYALVRDTQGLNFDSHFKLLDDINMAIIDFDENWMVDVIQKRHSGNLLRNFFNDHWSVKEAVENTVLFEKNRNGVKLVEHSHSNFDLPDYTLPSFNINNSVVLLSSDVNPLLSHDRQRIPITFYWKANKNKIPRYDMYIYLSKDGRTIRTDKRMIGYLIYPTDLWKEGEYIKEHFWMVNPLTAPGRYTLEISFTQTDSHDLLPMTNEQTLSEKNQFYTLKIGSFQLE